MYPEDRSIIYHMLAGRISLLHPQGRSYVDTLERSAPSRLEDLPPLPAHTDQTHKQLLPSPDSREMHRCPFDPVPRNLLLHRLEPNRQAQTLDVRAGRPTECQALHRDMCLAVLVSVTAALDWQIIRKEAYLLELDDVIYGKDKALVLAGKRNEGDVRLSETVGMRFQDDMARGPIQLRRVC